MVLVAASSGCTVGPGFASTTALSVICYTTPDEPAVPKQPIALGERVTAEWWALFRSPQIDALVKKASAGSPTIESAAARLTEVQEAVVASSTTPLWAEH
jgi:outer membrane protein TolC